MFDVEQYLTVGVDAAVYFVLAVGGTAIYVLKLALGFLGGAEVGFEADDIDAGMDSTAAFSLFSVLSVLAFFMGAGWMGLACRLTWGMGAALSAAAATGFGTALLLATAWMMHGVRKMTHMPRYELKSAIGRTGRVYLTIPPKGQGQGQIEITVSGRRKIMAAVSSGDAIPAFESATIVGIKQGEVLVVRQGSVPRSSRRRGRWRR